MHQPVADRFSYERLTSIAALSKESGAFTLKIIKQASDPASVSQTERLFRRAVESRGRPEPMNERILKRADALRHTHSDH